MLSAIVIEWVGVGFTHGCLIYGAVWGATVVFSLFRS